MKKIFLFIALTCSILSAKSQERSLEAFLILGEDAGTMLQSYLEPAFNGTIYNLNNGWYRTAKPHKLLGFDITLNATLATVPSSHKNFTFKNSDYKNVYIKGTSPDDDASVELPTVFGGETNQILIYEENIAGETITRTVDFEALGGLTDDIGFDQVPAAMIQAGIGLPFKTDVSVRYIPEVGSDEFKANLFGIGVKHNILQYFPIANRIPLVDISLFGGYTKLDSQYLPGGEGQSIDMEVKTFTGQVLGSVDLKLINFFVGVGYSKGESSLKVIGEYEYEYQGVGLREIDQESLPNISNDVTSFMTTAGMSIKLSIL